MKKNNRYKASFISAVAICLFIFEQSPANEMIRAWAGFTALDVTQNIFLVAFVVGAITLVVELTSSVCIALALNYSSKFKKYSQRLGGSSKFSETKNSSSDYALALSIGAGTLVLKKHLKNKNQNLRSDILCAWKATLVITVFSAFIAFLASGGIELAQRYGLGTPAEYFLGLATDWRFWLVVVVVSQAADVIKWQRQKKLDK